MTDIAAEAVGYKTIATAEIDPFCRKVLKARYPDAQHFKDVRHIDAATPGLMDDERIRRPLCISGGFPCQDVSGLGAGQGLSGSRSGLWSEFARIIREFKPELVLIENSPMLRSRGLSAVLADLAVLGYDARWDCIPAAFVGAPHLRDRIFIVAAPSCPEWSEPDDVDASFAAVYFLSSGFKLPRAGSLCNGFLYEGTPLATQKAAKAKLVNPFPTPRAAANEWRTTKNAPTHGNGHGATLAGTLNDMERAAGRTPAPSSESAGNINPEWVEWLMGIPQGWTDPRVDNDALMPHTGWSTEPTVPRTLEGAYERRSRLRALGNGLVPQAAKFALDNLTPQN